MGEQERTHRAWFDVLDLLRQTEFHFVVFTLASAIKRRWNEQVLSPPFCYPYGTDHRESLKHSLIPVSR
jgi:hypothetical protein